MILLPGEDPAVLRFDLLRGTSMGPADGHLHRAEIDFSEPGALTSRWNFWHDGHAGVQAVIRSRREE
jgi:hypothetical protein